VIKQAQRHIPAHGNNAKTGGLQVELGLQTQNQLQRRWCQKK
jgi:hypothetical protein